MEIQIAQGLALLVITRTRSEVKANLKVLMSTQKIVKLEINCVHVLYDA